MLNHAAALSRSNPSTAPRVGLFSFFVVPSVFAALAVLLAGSASALDGIDLSRPAEDRAQGECSALVQIKYPFLRCATGEIGQTESDELWETHRRIPIMSRWTEGDGAWGPDLNSD